MKRIGIDTSCNVKRMFLFIYCIYAVVLLIAAILLFSGCRSSEQTGIPLCRESMIHCEDPDKICGYCESKSGNIFFHGDFRIYNGNPDIFLAGLSDYRRGMQTDFPVGLQFICVALSELAGGSFRDSIAQTAQAIYAYRGRLAQAAQTISAYRDILAQTAQSIPGYQGRLAQTAQHRPDRSSAPSQTATACPYCRSLTAQTSPSCKQSIGLSEEVIPVGEQVINPFKRFKIFREFKIYNPLIEEKLFGRLTVKSSNSPQVQHSLAMYNLIFHLMFKKIISGFAATARSISSCSNDSETLANAGRDLSSADITENLGIALVSCTTPAAQLSCRCTFGEDIIEHLICRR